jgi:phospholipase/carboxylesterase
MADGLDFIHVYQPATAADAPTMLLLHGTGGDERDLLALGPALAPGAGVLSPRGQVLERGMPRFFRRLAEGVFDLDDLRKRTDDLADFVTKAAAHYGFDPSRVVAAGFSNGANIAASLLLLRPEVLAGGILFRAMVPLVPDPLTTRSDRHVLLSNGAADPLIPAAETDRLAALLTAAGVNLTVKIQRSGHELTPQDVTQAREWLAVMPLASAAKTASGPATR